MCQIVSRQDELKIAFHDPINEYYLGDDTDPMFIEEELENRDYYIEKIYFGYLNLK